MKMFHPGWAIALSWVGACAAAADATVPGKFGNDAVTPTAIENPDADQVWAHVAALIQAIPAYNVASTLPNRRPDHSRYFLWQEFSNQLLRKTGLAFCRQYPDDARCWTWLEATRVRSPQYWNIGEAWGAQESSAEAQYTIDETERGRQVTAWKEAYAGLRDAAIVSDTAPEAFRISLWVERIRQPLDEQIWSRIKKSGFRLTVEDIDILGADLQALGEAYPDAGGSEIRSLTWKFFRVWDQLMPAEGKWGHKVQAWRATLSVNPNRQVREMAGSALVVAEARSTPVEMSFTAIDGREVDLQHLRGKVVLIVFHGVSWCGACRNEEPFMKAAHERYNAHGFEIITITYERTPDHRERVMDFIKERGLRWPHFFDGLGAESPYVRRFGISAVPQHFLLNQEGLLVSTDVRRNKLEPAVRALLGLPPEDAGPR